MSLWKAVDGKIRVVVIDDHPLIRAGIRAILSESEGVEIVAEGSDGEAFERLSAEYQPDIILLDLQMPHFSGRPEPFRFLPSVTNVTKQYPQIRIIIVSQHGNASLIEKALHCNINGYLLKDDALSLHLFEAIQTIHFGGGYFSREIGQMLIETRQRERQQIALTTRQQEILQIITENPERSYAQHATALFVSEHTFSNHLRQIFERLEVNNVTSAVLKGLQLGVVTLPSR